MPWLEWLLQNPISRRLLKGVNELYTTDWLTLIHWKACSSFNSIFDASSSIWKCEFLLSLFFKKYFKKDLNFYFKLFFLANITLSFILLWSITELNKRSNTKLSQNNEKSFKRNRFSGNNNLLHFLKMYDQPFLLYNIWFCWV